MTRRRDDSGHSTPAQLTFGSFFRKFLHSNRKQNITTNDIFHLEDHERRGEWNPLLGTTEDYQQGTFPCPGLQLKQSQNYNTPAERALLSPATHCRVVRLARPKRADQAVLREAFTGSKWEPVPKGQGNLSGMGKRTEGCCLVLHPGKDLLPGVLKLCPAPL